MAHTDFVDGLTLSAEDWFNDVDRLHYTIFGDPATVSAARNTLMAAADVVAHATTSNIWGAREITLTGAAVTFTDIVDAPVAGAVAWVKQNAAHVWTNGATFAVQGGANYTAAAGDWIRVYATTVSTFEVTVFPATGFLPTAGGTMSGLLTANAGATVASGQTLTLTGATVAGAPTWSSSQAITLSTAAQPNVTSVGTLTGLTLSELIQTSSAGAGTTNIFAYAPIAYSVSTLQELRFTSDNGTTPYGVAIRGGLDYNGVPIGQLVGYNANTGTVVLSWNGSTGAASFGSNSLTAGTISGTTGEFSDTTDTTNTVTGSLHTAGGIGIAKSSYIGGYSSIQGGIGSNFAGAITGLTGTGVTTGQDTNIGWIRSETAGVAWRELRIGGHPVNIYANGSLVSAFSSTGLAVTGTTSSTAFSGPLTGNVTGNVSGSSGSTTGSVNGATYTAPTAAGDSHIATAANAMGIVPATASVAAHATTCNIWSARETVLSGGAVTFTDIADAPYAGAVAWVKQNAAHVWTNGATFAVQGGANYTAAAGDWIRVYATTVSTFEVTIFKASGIAAAQLAGSEAVAGVLELATVAEVLAGTDSERACSPLNLASNKVFAANGYYKFPGAFIVQWGTFNIAGGSVGSTLTFPTAFPTACASVVATLQNAFDTIRVDSIGVSTCVIYSGSGTPNCTWVAVGY